MTSLLSRFMMLPGPARGVIFVLAGGGLIGALWTFGVRGQMLYLILIGILLMGLLVIAFKQFLKWREKKKAAPMARGLTENAGAAPQNVSDPARRAQLDELRRTFEDGVQKFHAAGKNVYSMPWYVLVGEPGSGKTEAIRHCNVGFPPGMQDQLQGAGGTINMNWWFTNQAIIIDTAGRLMFEEVEAGGGPEWREFLKLLKSTRPNCPINGMLLVIPADSLIRDTADKIESKAGQIARQFDDIQRLLGVRFPVFVVITKCDLITGFREFFDTIDDPQLQHQMIGWSNPLPLDAPFDPSAVEQHLTTVRERLLSNRMWLLRDPVHTEDPSARRTDQVDALYAFPEALMKIVPRLRRYLEMVFVSGEWSPKPLFIRGIYFTSSLREGSALDAELAEAMGVTVESLPAGPIWERDRAFFLRDLFLDKVFKERGLVTQASNVKGQQRKRRAMVLGAGVVTALLLLGATLWSAGSFKENLGGHVTRWEGIQKSIDLTSDKADRDDIFWTNKGSPQINYNGVNPLDIDIRGQKPSYGSLPAVATPAIQESTPSQAVPPVFKPISWATRNIGDGLDAEVDRTFADVLEKNYLRPIILLSSGRLRYIGDPNRGPDVTWTDHSTDVLEQLIRVRRLGSDVPPQPISNDDGSNGPSVRIAPFMHLAAEDSGHDTAPQEWLTHAAGMEQAFDWVFGRTDGARPSKANRTWGEVAKGINADGELDVAIEEGVALFIKEWQGEEMEGDATFAMLRTLHRATGGFESAEKDLWAVASEYLATQRVPTTGSEYGSLRSSWNRAFAKVATSRDAVVAAMAALDDSLAALRASDADATVSDLAADAIADAEQKGVGGYTRLMSAALGDVEQLDEGDPLRDIYVDLSAARDQFTSAFGEVRATLEADLARFDEHFLTSAADGAEAQFLVRCAMYEATNDALSFNISDPTLANLAAELDGIDAAQRDAKKQVDSLLVTAGAKHRDNAANTAKFMIEQAQRSFNKSAITQALAAAPATGAKVAELVAREVPADTTWVYRPIPLTPLAKEGQFDPAYNPDAAEAFFNGWERIAGLMEPVDGVAQVLDRDTLVAEYEEARAQAYSGYAKDYFGYWLKTGAGSVDANRLPSWADWNREIARIAPQTNAIIGNIKSLNTKVTEALTKLPLPEDPSLAADVNKTLTKLREENVTIDDGAFVGSCARMLDAWGDLWPEVERSRDHLIHRVDTEDFVSDYLAGYTVEGIRPGLRYIDSLIAGALEQLAREHSGNALDAYFKLVKMDKFPLCADCPDELTWQDLQLADRYARTVGAGPSGGAGMGAKDVDASKLPTALQESYRLLAELNQGSGRVDDRAEAWAAKLQTVIAALVLNGEPRLSGTINLLAQQDQIDGCGSRQKAYVKFRRVLVEGDLHSTTTASSRVAKLAIGEGKSIGFGFVLNDPKPGEAPTPVATESLNGQWRLLRKVAGDSATKTADGYTFPLEVDYAGTKYCYMINVTFEGGSLPDEDNWPKRSDWPN